MYGYIQGYSDTDDIEYCPRCGEKSKEFFMDGTAECSKCFFHFGVVESEEE